MGKGERKGREGRERGDGEKWRDWEYVVGLVVSIKLHSKPERPNTRTRTTQ